MMDKCPKLAVHVVIAKVTNEFKSLFGKLNSGQVKTDWAYIHGVKIQMRRFDGTCW